MDFNSNLENLEEFINKTMTKHLLIISNDLESLNNLEAVTNYKNSAIADKCQVLSSGG